MPTLADVGPRWSARKRSKCSCDSHTFDDGPAVVRRAGDVHQPTLEVRALPHLHTEFLHRGFVLVLAHTGKVHDQCDCHIRPSIGFGHSACSGRADVVPISILRLTHCKFRDASADEELWALVERQTRAGAASTPTPAGHCRRTTNV